VRRKSFKANQYLEFRLEANNEVELTVKELVEALSLFPKDARVYLQNLCSGFYLFNPSEIGALCLNKNIAKKKGTVNAVVLGGWCERSGGAREVEEEE
jgi:hypothetical protein